MTGLKEQKLWTTDDDVFVLRNNRGEESKVPGISFDFALTASKSQKDKAGILVVLATIGGGANVEKGIGDERSHRIKFEVGLDYVFG